MGTRDYPTVPPPEDVAKQEGEVDLYDRQVMEEQLDAFAEKHDMQSIKDRLRIGLNEVAILALDQTNSRIKEICTGLAETEEQAEEIYSDLVDMCVEIQHKGPWNYAKELANSDTPESKAWYMTVAAVSMDYEREKELSDIELVENVKRVEGNLDRGVRDPQMYFSQSREFMLEDARKNIRFDDKNEKVPIGEGFNSFLPMALMGYEAGVVQDQEWIFVGAKDEIPDSLVESCGLKRVIKTDDEDESRLLTFYQNSDGIDVVKKVHPGLLVMLVEEDFRLAKIITEAINDKKESLDVADDCLGHTRVVQTSEAKRIEDDREDSWTRRAFLRIPELKMTQQESTTTEALSRPKEEFYNQMLYIRGMFVYLDALDALEKRRASQGKEVSEQDRDSLSAKIWNKMEQKVDELRHINELLEKEMDSLPEGIHRVIDMAGGAGDLGLAVTSELFTRGKDITRMDVVDPQEGVDRFMNFIIDHLPPVIREKLKDIGHHALEDSDGYLQNADITPDSMVVAKHACGTLTDHIISQWAESDSKMLVAMTCCQDKAVGKKARYGFKQEEWDRLCKESAATGQDLPEQPGKARDKALRRLERGKEAMKELDMARVRYLRRHGFKAELDMTDKFPKGDTIIARRLPDSFMKKVYELRRLEMDNPTAFDNVMQQIDKLSQGDEMGEKRITEYGHEWSNDDFKELSERFSVEADRDEIDLAAKEEEAEEREKDEAKKAKKEAKKAAKAKMQVIFPECKGGRVDLYLVETAKAAGKKLERKEFGPLVGQIQKTIKEMPDADPTEVRAAVDALMAEKLS